MLAGQLWLPILNSFKKAAAESSLETAEKYGLKSRTTVLLEATSNYLSQQQRAKAEKQNQYGVSTPRSITSLASLDGRLRRGFGLAPWHRRNSHESFLSASSSIHRLLMGKTPSATPKSEGRYIGPRGESFQKGIENLQKKVSIAC